jgi:hypothetical protein
MFVTRFIYEQTENDKFFKSRILFRILKLLRVYGGYLGSRRR